LKQILLNLLSNGVKYNRPGGAVTVRWTAAETARITVTDTGYGIPRTCSTGCSRPSTAWAPNAPRCREPAWASHFRNGSRSSWVAPRRREHAGEGSTFSVTIPVDRDQSGGAATTATGGRRRRRDRRG